MALSTQQRTRSTPASANSSRAKPASGARQAMRRVSGFAQAPIQAPAAGPRRARPGSITALQSSSARMVAAEAGRRW